MTESATTPNGDVGPSAPPSPAALHVGKDWFHLVVFEWMWREDGLTLKPGAELMVYATIYRASTHGGGAYLATNSSMGRVLGYPRETISRTVNKLIKRGLVWVVTKVAGDHGGRPVNCYAVTQGAIDAAQARIAALDLERTQEGRVPEEASTEANVTRRHIGTESALGTFRQGVTNRHATDVRRDETSCDQRDETSIVTKRHIGKNGGIPAKTPFFDDAHMSTYHISTDKGNNDGAKEPPVSVLLAGTSWASELTATDMAAFENLLSKSLLPVDAGFVGKNLREFARIVTEGVPSDVILSAYDDYAAYQRRMLQELGESRPMHLLKWLRQTPNKNILYVLNSRDGQWAYEHAVGRVGRTSKGGAMRQRPTHENPRLTMCRDRGEALWLVSDERGSRFVEGSENVESMTQARELYERMYASEARQGW